MKAAPLYVNRARKALTVRYGRVMEIACGGARWDDEWIDEAAACVDQLAYHAGLTDEQWAWRSARAFDLFTSGRRFDPRKWTSYVHAIALRLEAQARRRALTISTFGA